VVARVISRRTSDTAYRAGRDKAGVGDDAAEFGFVSAVADAGGVYHVFFDQNAADIVGAELQSDWQTFIPE